MANVQIVYDEDRLTIDDIMTLEEAKTTRERIHVLAKLVQNGNGAYVEQEDGFQALRQFTVGELRKASEQIAAAARGQDVGPK